MSKGKKNTKLIYNIAFGVVPFLICIFCSLSFMNSQSSTIDAVSSYIHSSSKNNPYNKSFLLTTFNEEKPSTIVNRIFLQEYGLNFSGNTQFCSYSKEDGDFYRFNLSCAGATLSDVSWCDLYNYSNQVELKRFETININLFKTPNKLEEHNTYNTSGFIYIPDYFADQIIDSSNGELTDYYSLLPDLSKMSTIDRQTFLDKYTVSILNVNNEVEKYKIANIFHVTGFKDYGTGQYFYNDDDSGAVMKAFLGNYAFIVANVNYLEDEHKVLVSIFDNKTMIISEKITRINEYDTTLRFYSMNKGNKNVITLNEDSVNDKLLKTQEVNTVPFLVFIVFSIIFIVMIIFYFLKKIEISSKTSLVVILIFATLSLILQLLSIAVFSCNLQFLLLYNIPFNVGLLLFLILFAVLYVFERFKNDE